MFVNSNKSPTLPSFELQRTSDKRYICNKTLSDILKSSESKCHKYYEIIIHPPFLRPYVCGTTQSESYFTIEGIGTVTCRMRHQNVCSFSPKVSFMFHKWPRRFIIANLLLKTDYCSSEPGIYFLISCAHPPSTISRDPPIALSCRVTRQRH